jgi:hypothetical protein
MALYTMSDLLYGVGGSVNNVVGGIVAKLSFRQDVASKGGLQDIADGILELSRNYRYQGLERTGPLVTLVPGQFQYEASFFENYGDIVAFNNINLIPSFYINYITPGYVLGNGNYQAGSGLTWKSIDSLELMFNLNPGVPAYWTRYQDSVYIAPPPQAANTGYMRYQVEHPFSNPVSGIDPFLLPNEWREIAEFAGAMRFAAKTRMLDYAKQYHDILYGDPDKPDDVGLIKSRITQIQGDSTANTSMRSIQVRVSRY